MAPQSEALKQSKARYYQKKRLDPEYMEAQRTKAKMFYDANKEKCHAYSKKYLENNKEKVYEQMKVRRDNKKIDDVKTKLEQIDTETLAKILIEARKVGLLNIE